LNMIKNTKFSLTLVVIISLLVVSFPSLVTARTVTDDLGRKVQFDGLPDRIVTTIVSTTEIALDLGLGDKLVGVTSLTQYLTYVPELQKQAKEIEGVGGFSVSLEKIAALDPDLAIIDVSAQKDLVEKLTNMGITFYAMEASNLEDVKEDILEIGYLTGTLDRAQEIVGDMVYKEVMLETAVAELDKRTRIFYTVSEDMYTTGSNTFVGKGLELAGLENVFSDISGWKPVSNEEIVDRDPEMIIATEDMGLDVDSLKNRPGFKKITAIQEENLLLLPSGADSMLNEPATKIVDGIINLFEMAYGKKVEL